MEPVSPNPTGLSSTKISKSKDGAVATPRIWEKLREVQNNLSRGKKPKKPLLDPVGKSQ